METGDVTVLMGMEVVEEVEDDLTQISLEEAREIYEEYTNGARYSALISAISFSPSM